MFLHVLQEIKLSAYTENNKQNYASQNREWKQMVYSQSNTFRLAQLWHSGRLNYPQSIVKRPLIHWYESI